jgi:surface polysaccharide O-acyltransferase-like enzyme
MARRLLLLNGLAISAVILFHAEGWGFTALFSWSHRYLPAGADPAAQASTAAYYLFRLIEQLVVFTIPAFLFVSGFFVAFSAGRSQAADWRGVLSRARHLAIPYLVWTAVYWAAGWLEGSRPGPAVYAWRLLTGSTHGSYYFVPLLIQLYLLAPIIVTLARRNWKALLIVTGLLQIVVHAVHYPDLLGLDWPAAQAVMSLVPKWFFPARLFWFSFGVVAGFQLPALKQALARTRWLALAALALLLVVGVAEWEAVVQLRQDPSLPMRETVVDALYAFAGVWVFLAFSQGRLPALADTLSNLGARSYGIYLVHPIVMEFFARGIYHLAPGLLAFPVVFMALVAVVGLGGPLLLMFLVSRSPARPLYAYQFG